uniref:CHORD domain-containing protein n=1 Tax=Chromera velia CCMP2878 TaxID=1169474 RepID=A0A0G4H9F9_9ALVE|mmetsp:Transcript_17670/g.35867  ORF Transcript_17670/g.35867 Transcript_17670/m.35867 type:complete len:179 (+) Transcript_17670:187-723(+)|eukprot:Cvel_25397.t1-p1 / transcript=Cvel_25397.t1 / gene=Cvel_25397 / organism=Chromera_velia_CCMP2878 / gene_product=hypothetical protein / transcript_product=hypothetical protein / location=Cvel_scaffold2872:10816-12906(+) / protein_length=178 / sequence_SO=supercontig / SO=protein_coding / is_pseudo=false
MARGLFLRVLLFSRLLYLQGGESFHVGIRVELSRCLGRRPSKSLRLIARRSSGLAVRLEDPGLLFSSSNDEALSPSQKEGDSAPSSLSEPESTCRQCKKPFLKSQNAETGCVFHPGFYTGRLNRVNDVDTSDLEFFWSCCGEYDRGHPGCTNTHHVSYDDEGPTWSVLTGKIIPKGSK